MKIAKDGIRSIVRIGYDGRVHKTFRGTDRDKRFANEIRVLKVLEARGCDFVPRLLDSDEEELSIVTTNCGSPAPSISKEKADEMFRRLEEEFYVVHEDPFSRNITYNAKKGRFFIIDFELADVKDFPEGEGAGGGEGMGEGDEATRTLEWAGATRAGIRKKENQDALSVFSSEEGWARSEELEGRRSIDEAGLIFAVSDGMGGPAGGGLASKLVVQELRRFLPAMMGDFRQTAQPNLILESAMKDLHDYVGRTAAQKPGLEEMGATVVCGLFFRTAVHFGHVGDSRFYRWRKGELTQLTHDHTYVGGRFRAGDFNEREARTHPVKNVLTQAIGGRCNKVDPQVDDSSLLPGDWFLICSDGIVDGLWNKNIAEAFAEGGEKGLDAKTVRDRLLEQACQVAGKDDTTLFVVKVA